MPDDGISSLVGSGIGAVASYLGGEAANDAAMDRQLQAQQFNAKEAQNSREAALYMSNTSHQREVADLKAAGINPILAAQKGASTQSGGSATSPSPPGVVDKLGNAVSTALQSLRLKNETEAVQAEVKNKEQNNLNLKAQERLTDFQTLESNSRRQQIDADKRIKDEVLQTAMREAAKAKTDEEFYNSKFGRVLRTVGTTFRELNPFVSTSKDLSKIGN